MIAMAFDGASATKHLAALLKIRVSKHAFYVHCFAHCNELVFKDATALSSLMLDVQDLSEQIYVLAVISPDRILLFRNIRKEMLSNVNSDTFEDFNETLQLKNLSRMRWTTRGAAANVIFQNYNALQETLKVLSTDLTVTIEFRAKAIGLLKKLKSFSDKFKLIAMNELASLLEVNSKQLQSFSLTAEQTSRSMDMMYIRLDELRIKKRV